jgi:hypothetical protein
VDNKAKEYKREKEEIEEVNETGGNRSIQRKPPTCHKSLTNFIT